MADRHNLEENPGDRRPLRPRADRRVDVLRHIDVPDILEGAGLPRRVPVEFPRIADPLANLDIVQPSLELERNAQVELARPGALEAQPPVAERKQVPVRQIRPTGALQNLVRASLAAGGVGGLHQALPEVIEAQPPVPERKEAQGLRPQGALQNLVRASLAAGGVGGLHHALPEVIEAQPPVPERKEAQGLRPQGALQNLVQASLAAGGVGGLHRALPEALAAQPPEPESKEAPSSQFRRRIQDLVQAAFSAGGGGRLEHAVSEPLEAQPPVPERKEARSSQLRSQGVIQSLVLASFAAENVGGLVQGRPEALPAQPPVAEGEESQRNQPIEEAAGSSAELRPEEQEVLRVEPPVYERKEQVQESQLRLQPPVPQPNPIKLIVSIDRTVVLRHVEIRIEPPVEERNQEVQASFSRAQSKPTTQKVSTGSTHEVSHERRGLLRVGPPVYERKHDQRSSRKPITRRVSTGSTHELSCEERGVLRFDLSVYEPTDDQKSQRKPITRRVSTGSSAELNQVQREDLRVELLEYARDHGSQRRASIGSKRRLQPESVQPSTSQQAATSSSYYEPVGGRLPCPFCPVHATNQGFDYSNLPHGLRNFDATTVDNIAIKFCKKVLAKSDSARQYIRSIQSRPPNRPSCPEVTDRKSELQSMRHEPFCPLELLYNWPDPPMATPVQDQSLVLKRWDPVSVKKAKRAYCKEVLKHGPDTLEFLTGLRSISPDSSSTSTSAESVSIRDSVRHQNASCPLILFKRCLPSTDRSHSPPFLQKDPPGTPKQFRRFTASRQKDQSQQTACPTLPEPLPSFQSRAQKIATSPKPTDPECEDCPLCYVASTSEDLHDTHARKSVMQGFCRELLLNSPSASESIDAAPAEPAVGPRTVQHHPDCVVPTLQRCPYCRMFQHAQESQNVSEIATSSRASEVVSRAYVRSICTHDPYCSIELIGYCPECTVDPASERLTSLDPRVEAMEVEEQHSEAAQSRPSSEPNQSSQDEELQSPSSMSMTYQDLDDDETLV